MVREVPHPYRHRAGQVSLAGFFPQCEPGPADSVGSGQGTLSLPCKWKPAPPEEEIRCCPVALDGPIPFVYLSACRAAADSEIKAKGERLCACALQSNRENAFRSGVVSSDLSISYF